MPFIHTFPVRHLLYWLLPSLVSAIALHNITLPLPLGTSTHNSPGLLCTPTKWSDLASFYLFNYIAHAATVLTRPGERSFDFVATVLGCLLFPALGLYRGIEAILSGSVFAKDDLTKAARSGALCMLVRSPGWTPSGGEIVGHVIMRKCEVGDHDGHPGSIPQHGSAHIVTYQAPWTFSRFGRPIAAHRQLIHGTYVIPQGYHFAIVPGSAHFTSPALPLASNPAAQTTSTCTSACSSSPTVSISSTYNLVKALIALAQTGYASLTLYRSRGDQIQQFGFAAFGLTVAPYAVMSIVNLVGNLCRPEYASL
ncbi:uncharacterized protein BDR25DRAFT_276181, partial [Lindgomyces ingoldianus]